MKCEFSIYFVLNISQALSVASHACNQPVYTIEAKENEPISILSHRKTKFIDFLCKHYPSLNIKI